MFAFDTATASWRESANIETTVDFGEPHLLQVGDLDELLPNEFPQSHLRNCHSSLTNIANNAGSSLCRGKDEHLGPSKVAHNECN